MIPEVIEFIEDELEETEIKKHIKIILSSWMKISKIISITYINNTEEYEHTMLKYSRLIKQYDLAATHTIFCPKNSKEEETENENYYSHVLICYTEKIMRLTYQKYRMGMGILSMQGHERRNKESKNCATRFSNKKHNLCIQTIKCLFDVFFFRSIK